MINLLKTCCFLTDTLSVKLLHIIFERVTRWNILLVKEQKFRREFIEKGPNFARRLKLTLQKYLIPAKQQCQVSSFIDWFKI